MTLQLVFNYCSDQKIISTLCSKGESGFKISVDPGGGVRVLIPDIVCLAPALFLDPRYLCLQDNEHQNVLRALWYAGNKLHSTCNLWPHVRIWLRINLSKLGFQSNFFIFWFLDPCSYETWPPVLGCTHLLFCHTWHISCKSGLVIICQLYSNISSINTYQKLELNY